MESAFCINFHFLYISINNDSRPHFIDVSGYHCVKSFCYGYLFN